MPDAYLKCRVQIARHSDSPLAGDKSHIKIGRSEEHLVVWTYLVTYNRAVMVMLPTWQQGISVRRRLTGPGFVQVNVLGRVARGQLRIQIQTAAPQATRVCEVPEALISWKSPSTMPLQATKRTQPSS